MSPLTAVVRGVVSAVSSPILVFWLWAANVVVALPLAFLVTGALSSDIGASLVHENLRQGFDMGWYGEYQSRVSGVSATFRPSIIGVGAILDNLESWSNADFMELPNAILAAGLTYMLFWTFLLGGVLGRLHDAAGLFRTGEFFAGCGEYFFRYVRLAMASAVAYYFVYRIASRLFLWIERSSRDVTEESTILGYVLAATILVGFLLTFVHMVCDYAKIATFTEKRHSVLVALGRGLVFVLSHPGRCLAIYYLLGGFGIALLSLYAVVAPGVGAASPYQIAIGFAIGQIYIIAKLGLRLSFYASQMAYFESTR